MDFSLLTIPPLPEETLHATPSLPLREVLSSLGALMKWVGQVTHLRRGNVFCRVQSNSGRVLKCPRCHGRHHAGRAGGQADAGAGAVQRGHPRAGALLKHLEKYAGLSGAVIRLLKSY